MIITTRGQLYYAVSKPAWVFSKPSPYIPMDLLFIPRVLLFDFLERVLSSKSGVEA